MKNTLKFKKYLLVSCACALAFAGFSAAKASNSRLYVTGYLGLNLNSQSDFTESSASLSGDYDVENSISFAGALGLKLTPNIRLEGEISYRKSDIDKFDIVGATTVDGTGDIGTWLYMANLYYDFDTEWRNFRPYVTGGIGLASSSVGLDASAPLVAASDNDFGFAYQLGGGATYELEDGLSLVGDYRYIATSEITAESYSLNYDSHEFRLGVRYDIPVETIRKFEKTRLFD